MRFAAKRDATEPAIMQALQLAGWSVLKLSDTGAPDLLATRGGRVVAVECKSPGGTLTDAQRKSFPLWAAAGLPVAVCFTPAEALTAVGATNSVAGSSPAASGARHPVKHPAR